jgi:YbbR domain-containing protein
MSHGLRRALFENLSLKLISLTLAIFLFVFVRAEKQSSSQGTLTVTFDPPPGRVLAEAPPQTLRVSVSGAASRMQRFRFEDLADLHIDLRGVPEGYYKFREDLLDLPPDVKVVSMRPAGFTIRYEPLSAKVVPIKVKLQGQPAEGYRVIASRATPTTIRIEGPRNALLSVDALETQPVLVDGTTVTVVRRVGVMALPAQIRALSSSIFQVEVEVAGSPGPGSKEGGGGAK